MQGTSRAPQQAAPVRTGSWTGPPRGNPRKGLVQDPVLTALHPGRPHPLRQLRLRVGGREGGWERERVGGSQVLQRLRRRPGQRCLAGLPQALARRIKCEILREGCRESRGCSRDTYPESYITKYTSTRRLYKHRERWRTLFGRGDAPLLRKFGTHQPQRLTVS